MTSDDIRKAANMVFKDGIPKFPDEAKLVWFLSEIAAQLAEMNERENARCGYVKSDEK